MADSAAQTSSRVKKAILGPVLAGFMLDLLDFATYGPIGLWAGLVVGGLGGYFLATSMGVQPGRRMGYAAIAGVYCMLPFTAFVPAATLLGTLISLRERNPAAPDTESSAPASIEAEYEASWDEE